MKIKLIALALAFAPVFAHAAPEVVMMVQCGDKVISLYQKASMILVDDEKVDSIRLEPLITGGQQAFFKIFAEQGGSYTQYNMTWDEANERMTLSSQWMNADDKPLRAVDAKTCHGAAQFTREAPKALSTMEYLESLQEG
ncbi:TPA: hypothetical protein MB364_000845 [Klebsiella variicola subsp. variicola]|nr:hypothetical protein [Klebsiella variicola subsp. variicola]